ncbi:MAG: S8 family serine peptidase [Porphyrobacter sp.]|nr:S8 family serine peptidase [Porphyrobacter sp.]
MQTAFRSLGRIAAFALAAGFPAGHAAPAFAQYAGPEFDEPDEPEPPEIEHHEVEEPEVEPPEVEEHEVEDRDVEEPEIEPPEIEQQDVEQPEIEQPEVEGTETDQPGIEEDDQDQPEIEGPDDGETVGENAGENDDGEERAAEAGEDAAEDAAGAENETAGADEIAGSPSLEEWLVDVTQEQNPEYDTDGFPVQRGEIIAADLSDAAGRLLADHGFALIETSELSAIGFRLTRLGVPAGETALTALEEARKLDRSGVYDLGHFYAAPYTASGAGGAAGSGARPGRGGAGARNLRIGMIDSGVAAGKGAALDGAAIIQKDFGSRTMVQATDHGSAVAAILSRFGVRRLVVANVFQSDGLGNFTSAETISRALDWLTAEGVAVINISLTGPRNLVLDAVVERALRRGTLIVAAAGNNGPTAPPAYPAALPGVVAVTAVDDRRRVYRYANRGPYIDFAAHGVRVAVPMGDGTLREYTGTSFSAPRVAAWLAACREDGREANTCLAMLEKAAVDLGEPGRDEVYGAGYID